MKKHAKHIVSILGLAAFSAFSAPVVEKVLVRQQWPWNEKVEIEYVLTGVEGTADVMCEVYDGETRLNVPKSAFGGMRFGLSDGTYKMNFNPSFAFPAGTAPKKLEFRLAAAEQDPASPSAEVIYKIFSLHDNVVPFAADVVSGAKREIREYFVNVKSIKISVRSHSGFLSFI
jgi:hypothetical protein